ncbi:MAG: hypothetical protein AAF480_17855 [Actinomycetota bacterium]
MTLALATGASACSFEPIRQVESSAPPAAEPAVLAFDDPVDEQPPAAEPAGTADEPVRRADAEDFLEEREPSAWTVATSDASIGVHSAPGYLYTRLGVLGPGENVIGTGRRVATDAVNWMEIRWGDATAWVTEAAFTPLS